MNVNMQIEILLHRCDCNDNEKASRSCQKSHFTIHICS